MKELRWKLWELASWVAWWLCPDKKTLALVNRYGTEASRAVIAEIKAQKSSEAKP